MRFVVYRGDNGVNPINLIQFSDQILRKRGDAAFAWGIGT
jgi:hypothetical protein